MEPKIRFKGFEGEWKKVKFLEIFEFLKNNSLSRAELSSKGDFINIHYGDILIKYGDLVNIQNEELTYIRDCRIGQTLYKMCSLQNGDIIIADAAEDYSVGKCSEIVNIGNNKVVSGLHTIPCRPLITFAQGYLGHYINSNSYHNQLLPLIQGSKISSISKKALSQTSVFVPSYEEQQTIASYFRILDAKLQAYAKKVESLKKLKSASLVAMFPQQGETTPKVRFKGFEGEWSKEILGNIAKFSKGQGYSKSDLREDGHPIILYGRMYTKYQFTINNVDTFAYLKEASVFSEGNEIIMPASGETPEDIARASAVLKKGIILGGDLNIMHFDLKKHSTPFIALAITYSNTHYDLSKCAQGKSVVHLHNEAISKATITLPSYEEQQAIASFFRTLNRKIALETARLEKLKQIKLACLDKMFV